MEPAVDFSGARTRGEPDQRRGLLSQVSGSKHSDARNRRSEKHRSDMRRGGIVVAVGLWLLASSLNIGGLDHSNSWPLLLVLIGVALAAVPRGRKGRFPGVILIAWGALAAIAVNRLWGFGWSNIWPLFLVVIGLEMVVNAISEQRRPSSRAADSAPEDER